MFTIDYITEKLLANGLTEKTYEQLLQDCSDKVKKITDVDWQEINDRYNLKSHYDTIRKSCQTITGGVFVRDYYLNKLTNCSGDDEYLENLKLECQQIKKEKQKLFDERRDLNNALRKEARLEESFERIERIFREIGSERYPTYETKCIDGENTLFVCLADLHVGDEHYSFVGDYNSDIFKDRVYQYLSKILEIKDKFKAKNCVVAGLGDTISGAIHYTISVNNRETVVEQVKLVSEILTDFVYELGNIFENVNVVNIGGNHSRIAKKDEALIKDRLDNLVPWYMEVALRGCPNIHILNDNYIDDTLAYVEIDDKLYYIVHGDYDGMSDSAISKLALWSHKIPYAIVCGHKHHPATTEVQGIKVIQSGSMCGSGDEYTRGKRLSGDASQTVMVCNKDGIECIYNITLN